MSPVLSDAEKNVRMDGAINTCTQVHIVNSTTVGRSHRAIEEVPFPESRSDDFLASRTRALLMPIGPTRLGRTGRLNRRIRCEDANDRGGVRRPACPEPERPARQEDPPGLSVSFTKKTESV